MTLVPSFKLAQQIFFKNIGYWIFLIASGAIILICALAYPPSAWVALIVVLFWAIPATIYMLVHPFLVKRTYNLTRYRFSSDRIDFFEGFWTVEQKTCLYRDVKEISRVTSLFDRWFGVGIIGLSTAATGERGPTGITLRDIAHADDVFKKIASMFTMARGISMDERPVVELKPTFNLGLMLLRTVLFIGIQAIVLGWVGLEVARSLPKAQGHFLVVFSVVWLLLNLIALILRYLEYQKTAYRVYSDKVTFAEGFLTQQEKIVPLNEVREVTLVKTVFQRFFRLGSVFLSTAAHGTARPGLRFMDLENPEDVYRRLREVIERAKTTSV